MKILAIDGSPRKGNTCFMLDTILNSCKSDFEAIHLREKNIDFCGGGDYCCPKTGKCVIDDEMADIYFKMEHADIIILASPCFFSNVSGRMKVFMDRCNLYYHNKKLEGKKFFLLAVGGYGPSLKDELVCMKNFVKGVWGDVIGEYSAVADKERDAEKNDKVIKELEKIGRKL